MKGKNEVADAASAKISGGGVRRTERRRPKKTPKKREGGEKALYIEECLRYRRTYAVLFSPPSPVTSSDLQTQRQSPSLVTSRHSDSLHRQRPPTSKPSVRPSPTSRLQLIDLKSQPPSLASEAKATS
nr:hypothetical protein Iba_scaffold116CG0040 [Ipomoea batatas]GME16524.1 hypothetical protein Iba_scaffold17615CG0010 [Ipomoea batatas]